MLTTGTALVPLVVGTSVPPLFFDTLLQRSVPQHLYEHSPPASLQAFNVELASSQSALVEQDLAKDLVSPAGAGRLNLMESVAQ